MLLTSKAGGVRDPVTALLYSDTIKLMRSLEAEFPEVIKVSSIGKSHEGRNIYLITLDAREFIVEKQMAEVAARVTGG